MTAKHHSARPAMVAASSSVSSSASATAATEVESLVLFGNSRKRRSALSRSSSVVVKFIVLAAATWLVVLITNVRDDTSRELFTALSPDGGYYYTDVPPSSFEEHSKPSLILNHATSTKADPASTTTAAVTKEEEATGRTMDGNSVQPADVTAATTVSTLNEERSTLASESSSPPDYSSWIVLVEVSMGFYDFFLNWLTSFEKLGLVGLTVVVTAEDDAVYHQLLELQQDQTFTTVLRIERSGLQFQSSNNPNGNTATDSTASATTAFAYNTSDYKAMVSARPTHILHQLNAGHHVIYTDIDTVWRSNPLPYFASAMAAMSGGDTTQTTIDLQHDNQYHDALFQVDLDQCGFNNNFKPCYCTGLMVLRSNERTVKLMVDWRDALATKADMNQPIFNKILHTTFATTGLRHGALPRAVFPNGQDYFERYNEVQREATVVVHNNFIVGHDRKRNRFVQLGFWDKDAAAADVGSSKASASM